MSISKSRSETIQALNIQLRYASANSVLFSQAISSRVGLHTTDIECLDFLLLNGPATAGQLAALTGLTTGAVTAVVDRLEKAGMVRRERDPQDRRKVMVIADEANAGPIYAHAMKMATAMEEVSAHFSDEELEVVARFMEQANAAASDAINAVSQGE
jgi:DNA-binding MarR family transcriptional regulator